MTRWVVSNDIYVVRFALYWKKKWFTGGNDPSRMTVESLCIPEVTGVEGDFLFLSDGESRAIAGPIYSPPHRSEDLRRTLSPGGCFSHQQRCSTEPTPQRARLSFHSVKMVRHSREKKKGKLWWHFTQQYCNSHLTKPFYFPLQHKLLLYLNRASFDTFTASTGCESRLSRLPSPFLCL